MPIFQKRKAQNSASDSAAHGDSEKGSMTVFGLTMSVGIVAAGGIALDSMYYESQRIAAQDALDRCSVMAALAQNRSDSTATGDETDEEQIAKAKQVAQDCMSKSAAGSTGLTTTITTENSSRSAQLSGAYTFVSRRDAEDNESFAITSTATQKLPNLELTIAVDVSHVNFWNMARDPIQRFINTIAAPDTDNKISVNIVPFGKSVNVGPDIISKFNMVNEPPFSTNENRSCILLPENNKDDIAIELDDEYHWSWPLDLEGINTTTPTARGEYFERYTQAWADAQDTDQTANIGTGQLERLITPPYTFNLGYVPTGNCHFMAEGNSVLLGAKVGRPGDDTPSAVAEKISEITAYDSMARTTSLRDSNSAEGMKWALASMDPSMREIFRDLNGTSEASGTMDRPLNYNTAESLKVLLFIPNGTFNLADGNFDPQGTADSTKQPSRVREIRPEYLDGSMADPDIWRTPIPNTDDQGYRYSIRHNNAPDPSKPYWITASSYYTTNPLLEKPAQWAATPFQYPGGPAPVRQSWRDIFSKMTVDYLITALYQAPMLDAGVLPGNSNFSYAKLANDFTYIATDSTKAMSNFDKLCTEAKSKGVIIYTLMGNGTANIGGNGTWNTRAAQARARYTSCATSSAHSFTTSTVASLNTALRLISSNIAQMTLTQ